MKHLRATVLLVFSCVAATAAEPTFTSTLGPDELNASGLDGLTPAQVDRLNALVERYKSAEVKREVVKAVKETKEERKDDGPSDVWGAPDAIESRIAGSFNGWRGGTIFELENGQVWQQANPDLFVLPKPKMNPTVSLKRAGFGGYWLRVEGCPKVRVNRVK